MITNEQARIDAQASHAAYGDAAMNSAYELAKTNDGKVIELNDPKTGFDAKIYRKIGTDEYIAAFTGTQPNTSTRSTRRLGYKAQHSMRQPQ